MGDVHLVNQRAAAYYLDLKLYCVQYDAPKWLLFIKALFQTTWLEDTQVKAEHHQRAKQVPEGSISISLSTVTYHHIFHSFKIFRDEVNIATKKAFI